MPFLSDILGSAPSSSKILTISTLPFSQAIIRHVSPFSLATFISIPLEGVERSPRQLCCPVSPRSFRAELSSLFNLDFEVFLSNAVTIVTYPLAQANINAVLPRSVDFDKSAL